MINGNPEILSPGGDFNSAIHALENGADAVYIGLHSFSARSSAKNFSLDELRRLKTYCSNNGKKVYVAMNTLIKDSEISSIISILIELNEIEVDAIIVQDIGLSRLVKKNTKLPIHASTQLAVHNIHGVETLKRLGFSRVVLSRELNLNEISYIKKLYPEMELEVFIHGALCFGFSGLCLASGKMLERSANRGQCGQICRTWFNRENKKEFSLSLDDLNLNKHILELKKIGVESLKIEGRMKSPNYSSLTAKLYHNILNRIESNKTEKESMVEFNRNGHSGYIIQNSGGANINKHYPGHVGLKIGKIILRDKSSFTVKLTENLSERDGIMVLTRQSITEPQKFSAQILRKKGSLVTLKGKLPPNYEDVLYKISSHKKHLKEIKSEREKPWKSRLNIEIQLNDNNINISHKKTTLSFPIELQEANTPGDIDAIFHKAFYSGGDTKYNFCCNVKNMSNLSNPFIPLSILKKIRKEFQEKVVTDLERERKKVISSITIPQLEIEEKEYIRNSEEIPFVINFDKLKISNLTKVNGSYLLPLSPVIFNSELYLVKLKEFIKKHENYSFIIGLNNVSHISFISALPEETEYYADYALYTLNNYSKEQYKELIPNLKWTTKWIEAEKISNYPPIFISRTCLIAQKDGCPKNCKKEYNFTLNQNNNNFEVVINNCLTYIFNDTELSV